MTVAERVRSRLRALVRDQESGAAMAEFAIVFPVQLFLTLCVMQFSLILVAHTMVSHAAFVAARAALACDVQRGLTPEPNGNVSAARHAAALILGTIASNEGTNGGVPTDPIKWRTPTGDTTLANVQGAYGKTVVEVLPIPADQGYVAVRVQHDYVLWIPVACHFFAGLPTFGETSHAATVATRERQATCMRITKVGFLARPWRPAGRGAGGGSIGGMGPVDSP